MLINLISLSLQIISEKIEMPILFQTVFSVMASVVGIIMSMGFIRFCLAYADNRDGNFSDIYASYPLFWKYLGTSILYGLIVTGGLLLLIIPGFVWAYKFYFSQYLVVDQGLGPIAALKKSSQITNGHKWNLFVFSLVLVGLLLVMIIPFIVVAITAYYPAADLFLQASIIAKIATVVAAIVLYVSLIIVMSAFSALAYIYVYRRLVTMNTPSSIPVINPGFSVDQPEGRPTP